MEKHYSIKQIAEKMSIDEQTVRKWINEGKLKAFQEGKVIRVSEETLQGFINAKS